MDAICFGVLMVIVGAAAATLVFVSIAMKRDKLQHDANMSAQRQYQAWEVPAVRHPRAQKKKAPAPLPIGTLTGQLMKYKKGRLVRINGQDK